MGLISNFRSIGTPIVRTVEEFMDLRARELITKNFMRVGDVPSLYSQLEKTGGDLTLDTNKFQYDRLPVEHDWALAGAIVNYELSQRPRFRIPLEEETFVSLGKLEVSRLWYAGFRRRMSSEGHERLAAACVDAAEKIYQFHEDIRKA